MNIMRALDFLLPIIFHKDEYYEGIRFSFAHNIMRALDFLLPIIFHKGNPLSMDQAGIPTSPFLCINNLGYQPCHGGC